MSNTKTSSTPNKSTDIVPIADRMRYMLAFRLALGGLVAVLIALAPGSVNGNRTQLFLETALYAAAALVSHLGWRLSRRRGILIFGLALLVDGVYLGWASYCTGGAASPLRYLIIVHLIAVALLASYRTGLKMALWHSLLLLVVFYAQRARLLAPLHEAGAGVGTPFQRLLEFSAVFWLVTIATSTLSAVNERELRRRRFDLEALAAMAAALDDADSADVVAEVVVGSVAEAFDFERVLLLATPENDREVLAWRGPVDPSAPPSSTGPGSLMAASNGPRARLVTRIVPAVDPRLAAMLPDACNLVVVPLWADGAVLGVLIAEHRERMGTRIERRVVGTLERFVSHGTLALRNAWLLDRIRRLAATDGLTGLANRRTFDDTLQRELARAARLGEDTSLILLDLDHFKDVNDNHGHQTGDEVLRRVGAALGQGSRTMDTAARLGGEEFALILPAVSADEAVEIAERVRMVIASGSGGPRITASAGIASFPLDAVSAEALFAAADEALFESKRRGRDRVTKALSPLRAAEAQRA